MRLGGPLQGAFGTPEEWVRKIEEAGYRAAGAPVKIGASDAEIAEYRQAAHEADVLIAEVGAWGNPMSPDKEEREKAFRKCVESLRLAESLGARCCVNVAGSLGPRWDGPWAEDLTERAFETIVLTTRKIIDEVKPRHTFYTLETMPWMYPDSTASYSRLIEAIDRKGFAVHFDPANLVNSPGRYFGSGEMIREFVETLGPRIRSCHAKDVRLGHTLTLHIDEVAPGKGEMDYRTFLTLVDGLDKDLPVMLEHLKTEAEYREAARYVREVARELGLDM